MAQGPTIALDCMGGDFGPSVIVPAAEESRIRYPDVTYALFGNQAEIIPLLEQFPKLKAQSVVYHTDDKVLGTDKPSQALRRSRTSSMGLAIKHVKEGAAQVAVSAGNTGALMAIAKFTLRTMEGIDRPALVSLIPTKRAESVMLDLGANVDCTSENLVQFALMGAAFARTVLGLEKPAVALLNIGVEELKGTEELKKAAARLRGTEGLPLTFAGFIEGDKITSGDVDVIVTDGFTGNVALKTTEGTAKFIGGLLETAFRSTIWTKLGYLFARGGINALRDHLDPNNHNGAVFLGLNGLVVKSHGSASISGFASAIGVARDLVADKLTTRITEDLARLPTVPVVANDIATSDGANAA
jgi:glycerol-3-phosphate acyltransferase PlsX